MTNYQNGACFERRVQRSYESHGYFVVRSAGSHSPVDLVALKKDMKPLLIQCKTDGKLSRDERTQLMKLATECDGIAMLAYRVDRSWNSEELS